MFYNGLSLCVYETMYGSILYLLITAISTRVESLWKIHMFLRFIGFCKVSAEYFNLTMVNSCAALVQSLKGRYKHTHLCREREGLRDSISASKRSVQALYRLWYVVKVLRMDCRVFGVNCAHALHELLICVANIFSVFYAENKFLAYFYALRI